MPNSESLSASSPIEYKLYIESVGAYCAMYVMDHRWTSKHVGVGNLWRLTKQPLELIATFSQGY